MLFVAGRGTGIMNANKLKLFAVVTMLIDHLGALGNTLMRYFSYGEDWIFYMTDDFFALRLIGRISFPLFAYLIAQGCIHTHSLSRYIRNLFAFAILSQLPYQFFTGMLYGYPNLFSYARGNVLFTLAFGALAVWFHQQMVQRKQPLFFLGIALSFVAVVLFQAEYDISGVAIILCVYLLHREESAEGKSPVRQTYYKQALACSFIILIYYSAFFASVSQGLFASLCIFPLLFYNGQPGNRRAKWFFYSFYPVHFMILSGILFFFLQTW